MSFEKFCRHCAFWHKENMVTDRKRKCLVLQRRMVKMKMRNAKGKIPWRLTKTFPSDGCDEFVQRRDP